MLRSIFLCFATMRLINTNNYLFWKTPENKQVPPVSVSSLFLSASRLHLYYIPINTLHFSQKYKSAPKHKNRLCVMMDLRMMMMMMRCVRSVIEPNQIERAEPPCLSHSCAANPINHSLILSLSVSLSRVWCMAYLC